MCHQHVINAKLIKFRLHILLGRYNISLTKTSSGKINMNQYIVTCFFLIFIALLEVISVTVLEFLNIDRQN